MEFTINDVQYAVEGNHEYNLIVNINGAKYFYTSDYPFYIFESGSKYNEVFAKGYSYRTNYNANNVFSKFGSYGSNFWRTKDDIPYCNGSVNRDISQYIWSDHDIYYWDSDEIAVPSSIISEPDEPETQEPETETQVPDEPETQEPETETQIPEEPETETEEDTEKGNEDDKEDIPSVPPGNDGAGSLNTSTIKHYENVETIGLFVVLVIGIIVGLKVFDMFSRKWHT